MSEEGFAFIHTQKLSDIIKSRCRLHHPISVYHSSSALISQDCRRDQAELLRHMLIQHLNMLVLVFDASANT